MDNESHGWQENLKDVDTVRDTQMVDIKKFAKLTGFPQDFIKKELLLNSESEISIEILRSKVTNYLIKSQFEN